MQRLPQDLRDRIGDLYQQETKYVRGRLSGGRLDRHRKPDTHKTYPADLPRIPLPPPRLQGGPELWTVIRERRSIRRFQPEPVGLSDLSQLLWACQGVTARADGYAFRAAPSAGALYPIETYVALNRVHDVDPGLCHYDVRRHALVRLTDDDVASRLAAAALDQTLCRTAAVVFVWTAVLPRSKWKYGQRAYRYVYLDAGHIGHAVALAAQGMGLGSCAIGALYDDELNALLEVDGADETVVYLTVVGRPRTATR